MYDSSFRSVYRNIPVILLNFFYPDLEEAQFLQTHSANYQIPSTMILQNSLKRWIRHADFQLRCVQWHPWQIDWIQKFYWIINRFTHTHTHFYNIVDWLLCDCLVLNVGLNNIVKLVDVFILSGKRIDRSLCQSRFFLLVWILEKKNSVNFSFNVTKLQKLRGNGIRPGVRSTDIFPFPISSNWYENIFQLIDHSVVERELSISGEYLF